MSDDAQPTKSLKFHVLLASVVIVVLAIGYVLLSGEPEQRRQTLPAPAPETPQQTSVSSDPEPALQPDILEEPQEPVAVDVPEPEPEMEPEPEPLDVSDAAVKTAILDISSHDGTGTMLVNDGLLQRFVVFTTNMADGELAANHQILQPPQKPFRVYQQGGKEWIDPASYKRYSPYVEAFDSMETDTLVSMYRLYKPAIREIFSEIGDPDEDFDNVVVDAINHLLDTPEVPVPIEVYTDSVMFKYRDSRLEELSALQKNLLRTGPENMRLIKAKLREIKETL